MEKATEKDMTVIPYFAHEGMMVRLDRANKRLVIALIIAVVLNVLIVCGFLLYLNEYDFESYQQDGEGVNIIGNMNGVDYDGTTYTASEEEEQIVSEGQGN